jgi:hypothetical protein
MKTYRWGAWADYPRKRAAGKPVEKRHTSKIQDHGPLHQMISFSSTQMRVGGRLSHAATHHPIFFGLTSRQRSRYV